MFSLILYVRHGETICYHRIFCWLLSSINRLCISSHSCSQSSPWKLSNDQHANNYQTIPATIEISKQRHKSFANSQLSSYKKKHIYICRTQDCLLLSTPSWVSGWSSNRSEPLGRHSLHGIFRGGPPWRWDGDELRVFSGLGRAQAQMSRTCHCARMHQRVSKRAIWLSLTNVLVDCGDIRPLLAGMASAAKSPVVCVPQHHWCMSFECLIDFLNIDLTRTTSTVGTETINIK